MMTTHTPAIVAPDHVVHAWREESVRALAAVRRASDPEIRPTLLAMGRDGRELVAYLSEALNHAASILLGSAVNATPGVREVFDEELKVLVREVLAEQLDADLDAVAADDRAGRMAGDSGCEGGVR